MDDEMSLIISIKFDEVSFLAPLSRTMAPTSVSTWRRQPRAWWHLEQRRYQYIGPVGPERPDHLQVADLRRLLWCQNSGSASSGHQVLWGLVEGNALPYPYKLRCWPPLQNEVVEALQEKSKILERKRIIDRVISKMLKLVSTFDDSIGW